jgi:hypothetical protein
MPTNLSALLDLDCVAPHEHGDMLIQAAESAYTAHIKFRQRHLNSHPDAYAHELLRALKSEPHALSTLPPAALNTPPVVDALMQVHALGFARLAAEFVATRCPGACRGAVDAVLANADTWQVDILDHLLDPAPSARDTKQARQAMQEAGAHVLALGEALVEYVSRGLRTELHSTFHLTEQQPVRQREAVQAKAVPI